MASYKKKKIDLHPFCKLRIEDKLFEIVPYYKSIFLMKLGYKSERVADNIKLS